MEKLSIVSKNVENGQEKCPSEDSEETELCSCQMSELDLCSSLTDSSCFAKVIEKLLDQHKSREDQLMAEKEELKAEKQQLANKLEKAEQAIVELKKEKAENGPDLVEQLAIQMAEMAKEKDELKKLVLEQGEKMTKLEKEQSETFGKHQGQMKQLEKDKEASKKQLEAKMAKLVEEQAKLDGDLELLKEEKDGMEKHFDGKMAKLVEEQAEKMEAVHGQLEELNVEKDTLKKLVEKHANTAELFKGQMKKLEIEKNSLEMQVRGQQASLANLLEAQTEQQGQVEELEVEKSRLNTKMLWQDAKVEKLQGQLEAFKQKIATTEYARLIGVPVVANLFGNYKRAKLLQLIEHGNRVTPRLYIQNNQKINDRGLVQAIVNLLASTDKPEKMVKEVDIECWNAFTWPESDELAFKQARYVDMTLNEASGTPATYFPSFVAEYELINEECRFEVNIYYYKEDEYGHWVRKFVCRRLA